jgi:hypothetical protein
MGHARRSGAMPTREQIEAMTTNERLWETGQMADFETAEKERDFARMREILRSVFVDEPSIELMVANIRQR